MCRRVLIVDDNGAFRAAARQLLERGGFVVVAEAGDGAGGLSRRRRTHRPDLAIVDVQLPDFDGFEVAERLAELDPRTRGDPDLEPRRQPISERSSPAAPRSASSPRPSSRPRRSKRCSRPI